MPGIVVTGSCPPAAEVDNRAGAVGRICDGSRISAYGTCRPLPASKYPRSTIFARRLVAGNEATITLVLRPA